MIYGTGELAELAYLSLKETPLVLVGFVDGRGDRTFLSYPRVPVELLAEWDFDAVLIAQLEEVERIREQLARASVPLGRIWTLCPERMQPARPSSLV
jgi:hypothetical protein